MKPYINKLPFILMFVVSVFITSCVNDLDTVPIDEDIATAANVFDDPAAYYQFLAKIYSGLVISGQQGPAGNPDIQGIDEGFSSYIRQYWVAQELSTDEALCAWNDPGLPDMSQQTWSSDNDFVTALFNRIFFQVSMCNEFIRQTTDAKISDLEGTIKANVLNYRAEARFMRALSYWHAIDMFGSVPFVTEEDEVGAFLPEQISRTELFNYVESELLAILPDMVDAGQNEYGRADKAAVWMLLAKLYLNAQVYIGENKYSECITYLNNVIGSSYGSEFESNYQDLFLADNDTAEGIIFTINCDGAHTQTWGGLTFIIHAAIGGDMNAGDFGVDGGWGGNRATYEFANKFTDLTDSRALLFTAGQEPVITNLHDFKHGVGITKFKNVTSTGEPGTREDFPDTDFPVFRIADAYLMYAEATLRGGGGNAATAVGYVNQLIERAYGDDSKNIDQADLTLDFILDERARELYWECHRRTDLIRFGVFTGADYVWAFKGGVAEGVGTASYFDLFPIPSTQLGANPNLVQNTGY